MILIAYGTRPEYIKVKPLIDKFGSRCNVLFTGQHEQLSGNRHDFAISISDGPNRLDSIFSSIMNGLTAIVEKEPWITHVLVQGDTTSALAVAISAFHHGLKVVHLEAGLRSYDLNNPYPEEGNRRMISQIAKIHFCPTVENAKNIRFAYDAAVHVVGNTIIDSMVEYKDRCDYGKTVLVTMHRRENIPIMEEWFLAINHVAETHPGLMFIMPAHPNPDVNKHMDLLDHVTVVDQLSRRSLLNILALSRLVITDSGGIQEECSYLNKKCLVCRKTSERMEAVGKSSFLVPTPAFLASEFDRHINDYEIDYECPFGDGNSTELIYNILIKDFEDNSTGSQHPEEG